MKAKKNKIINDPVWGFLELNSGLVSDLLEHPYFQRLRRIRQLGLTSSVYPGANHTRFEHSLGAMHLAQSALTVLRDKGVSITNEEAEGVTAALLLHDIGHGPYSHALEESIVKGVTHEELSIILMKELNKELKGRLDMAIEIFLNQYSKHFLHLLVSSQLDMDRLDFLKRDSFYSGVYEGVVSSDRIIKMLDVRNDQLVVEEKGIYSVEKFLMARRLMYWQVYLHKTVVASEHMLIKLLQRAADLVEKGEKIEATPSFSLFLNKKITAEDFHSDDIIKRKYAIKQFSLMDDSDIISSMKIWTTHPDRILSTLSKWLLNRKLLKIKFLSQPLPSEQMEAIRSDFSAKMKITNEETSYFVFEGVITNNAYSEEEEGILILSKNGKLREIREASDINLEGLTKTVRKHFVCYPGKITLGK